MDSDKEDIKRLDLILAKSEPVQEAGQETRNNEYYIDSDDDMSDNEYMQHNSQIDFAGNIDLQSSSAALKLPKTYSNLNAITAFLTEEELEAITTCPDANLQKVMILNRAKQIKLKNTRIHFSNLLQRCYKGIEQQEEKLSCTEQVSKVIKTLAIRLGYPYFKGRGFTAPLHSEMQKKKANGEISPYYLTNFCRWTLDDQSILISSIEKNYSDFKEEVLISNISTLKKNLKECKNEDESKDLLSFIIEKEAEMKDLKNTKELPPLDFEGIDWMKVAEELGGRHTPVSCKAIWNVYLHPSVNNSPYTNDENNKITALVQSYNFQNWDVIASELGTRRSGFSICVHFFSKLHERYSTSRFSEEEDKLVKSLVNKYKVGSYIPWTKIAQHFKDRKREQLYHRYMYYLCNCHTVKGSFTDAEDILLICLSNKFGRDFKSYLLYMPQRSIVQIRHRFVNYLDKINLNLGNWTYEEDKKIMAYVSVFGDKNWSELTNYIPRNRYHCRQRYQSLKNYITKHPDKDIKDIPRRIHTSWKQKSKKADTMKRIAQEFQDNIPTLQEIEDFMNKKEPFHLRMKRMEWIDNDVADIQLLDYFKSAYKLETDELRPAAYKNLKQDTEIIKLACNNFKVNLNIPDESELKNHPALDEIDVQVLTQLKKQFDQQKTIAREPIASTSRQSINDKDRLSEYFPPTLPTLIALRSILIRYKSYKQYVKNSSEFQRYDWKSEEQLLFQERMNILFRWPCIMSLNQPSDIIRVTPQVKAEPPPTKTLTPLALRKIRMEKVRKMAEARRLKSQKPTTISPSENEQDIVNITSSHQGVSAVRSVINVNVIKEQENANNEEWKPVIIEPNTSELKEVRNSPAILKTYAKGINISNRKNPRGCKRKFEDNKTTDLIDCETVEVINGDSEEVTNCNSGRTKRSRSVNNVVKQENTLRTKRKSNLNITKVESKKIVAGNPVEKIKRLPDANSIVVNNGKKRFLIKIVETKPAMEVSSESNA